MRELVEKYISQFPKRYISVQTLQKAERLSFHSWGHWNCLIIEDGSIVHYYKNGATGELEKELSRVVLSEVGKKIYLPYKGGFFLLIRRKNQIKPECVFPRISTFCGVDKSHHFLNENGIQVSKRYWSFDENMQVQFKERNPFNPSP